MKQPTDTGVHVGCQKMLDLTLKSDQAKGLQRSYVFRLWAFLTLSNFHSYFLAFLQSLTTTAVDSTEMYEYIFARFLLDEAETFFVIEPLDGALN